MFALQRLDQAGGNIGVDGVRAHKTEVVCRSRRWAAEHQTGTIAQGSQLARQRPICAGLGTSRKTWTQNVQTVELQSTANTPASRRPQVRWHILARRRKQQRPGVLWRQRPPRRNLLAISTRNACAIDEPHTPNLLGIVSVREYSERDEWHQGR